jgi:dTDP-4-amino-4,6-dideoxygalactose transaminase
MWIQLPTVAPGCDPAWHVFVIQISQRDSLQRYLQEHGIGTLIHYPYAPHLQPAYNNLSMGVGSLPISEALHERVLSIPIGPHLTLKDIERVCDVLDKYPPSVIG